MKNSKIVIKTINSKFDGAFDTVIVDNSQMVPELEMCHIFHHLKPSKLVLFGDPQLPGTGSLFSRLVHEGGVYVLNQ